MGGKTEESRFEFRQGQQIIFFCKVSRPVLGPRQPPIQPVLGIKWPRREADRLPPSKDEVKKEWGCTTTPPYAFMVFLRTTLTLTCSLCYETMRAATPGLESCLQTSGTTFWTRDHHFARRIVTQDDKDSMNPRIHALSGTPKRGQCNQPS